MKYNWQYIFATSNKLGTIFFSIWGFITLVTPTDTLLDCIDKLAMRIFVAMSILICVYLLVVIGVSFYTMRKRNIKIFNLNSNHSLYVEYGDLFNRGEVNEEKNIAFAGNRCFDTIVDDDLVGTRKIHGIALNRIYQNGNRTPGDLNDEIQSNLSLHQYKSETLDLEEKRRGNLLRYEVGAVAEIKGLQNEKYFILGLTYFNKELRAQVEKEDYIRAIGSLIKYISNRSQGFPTYMPVIGTGGADVGTVNDLIVYMIKTIKLFKDRIDCDIHIVVSEKEEKIGLLNLKMI
jgi:hypothetical protein